MASRNYEKVMTTAVKKAENQLIICEKFYQHLVFKQMV